MRWCRDSIVCLSAGEERRLVNVVVVRLWGGFIVGFMILERLGLGIWRWRLRTSNRRRGEGFKLLFGVVFVADADSCDVNDPLLLIMA